MTEEFEVIAGLCQGRYPDEEAQSFRRRANLVQGILRGCADQALIIPFDTSPLYESTPRLERNTIDVQHCQGYSIGSHIRIKS